HRRTSGQSAADLHEAGRAKRKRVDGYVGNLDQREELEKRLNSIGFSGIGLTEARSREHVTPQTGPGVSGSIPQHEVLASRQSHEQLGLLEGAGKAAAGPVLRAR